MKRFRNHLVLVLVIFLNMQLKTFYGLSPFVPCRIFRIRGGRSTFQNVVSNNDDDKESNKYGDNNQRVGSDYSPDIQFKNSTASVFPTSTIGTTDDEISRTEKLDPSQQPNRKWYNWRSIKIFEPIFERLFSVVTQDPDILRISSKICAYLVWINILLSTLGTTGVDIKPILSLLSISALTVGFAAKDLLTDTFAGVSILLLRPFQRGDVITVGGFKGTVLSIDLKYVRLASSAADSKAAVVLIPLSVVYKGIIIRHNK